jgi:outer membrane protein insertion porin family
MKGLKYQKPEMNNSNNNSALLLNLKEMLYPSSLMIGFTGIKPFLFKNSRNKAFPGSLLKHFIVLSFAVLIFGSCSNLRYLDEGQRLYTGSEIKIESKERIRNEKEIRSEAESVIRPQPNTKILFWRPQLWFYNIGGDAETGIGSWIRNSLGRPPVLFEDVDAERTAKLIENRLFNLGHFDASVDYDLIEKRKRTGVEYNIELTAPYTIRKVIPVQGNSPVISEINLSMEETSIQTGQLYRLADLRAERERIDRHLKENGYYYFHPDFLIFMADSSSGNREIDLHMSIKPAAPQYALESYRIRNINIESGYIIETNDEGSPSRDKEEPGRRVLRSSALNRAIFLRTDSLYRNFNHRQTLNHLIGMGVFSFVNIRFDRAMDEDDNYMDVRIMLTPMDKRSISTELSGVTKSNNFAGPGITASFNNRNLFRGAENLNLNFEGSFETLMGQKGVNSTELGITAELDVPRLILPYKIGTVSPRFIPKTRMSLAYSFLSRTDAFSLTSFKSQFGYIWNPSRSVEHRFNPFVFNTFRLGTISPEFEDIFSREILLRRGLFEQFLIGSDYTFIYNSQLADHRRHDWYFAGNIDLSGNLARLVSNLAGAPKGERGDYQILNQSFSQFSRVGIDLRYYNNLGRTTRLATRFVGGIGLPYGNSEFLPYTKLFVIGGTNSIRAFQPRSLGPGAYEPPETPGSTLNIYQSGEIKLEMNIEYRFAFNNIIKGALFADAGNIWNLEENENAPGGKFHGDEFLSQIALGTGFGLRFDFTFFLLRLDLAFPLAVPYRDTNGYFQSVRPFDSQWRRDNLILNLAIGYPF